MKEKKYSDTKDFLKEKFNNIEIISNELEEATLPIEHLVDRYEEGMKIVLETKQFLTKIEGKIINIVEQQNKELN